MIIHNYKEYKQWVFRFMDEFGYSKREACKIVKLFNWIDNNHYKGLSYEGPLIMGIIPEIKFQEGGMNYVKERNGRNDRS